MFIILFIVFYGAINFYIGFRGWQSLGRTTGAVHPAVYWTLFWALALSYLAARLAGKFLPGFITNGLTVAGAYWLAAMIYFLLLLVAVDILRFLNHWLHFLPRWPYGSVSAAFTAGAAVLIFVLGILAYGTWCARNPVITRYALTVPKKAGDYDRLHMVAVSDTHLGVLVGRDRLDKLVDRINGLQPDIVLLVGDTIDDDIEVFRQRNMAEAFRKLKAPLGVFACLGNHEYYGGRPGDAVEYLEDAGITVLKDAYARIEDSFYVVGRDDRASEQGTAKRKPLESLMEGIDPALPVILLDHQPFHLEEAEKNGVDLQLSGHTHRGQLFPNQWITRRVYEKDWGYLKKGNLQLVVTRGYGTWGPPIRTSGRAEIVDIVITFKE